MKISTLASVLSIMAAVNIFYAIFMLTQDQFLNSVVFMVTFLVIMYSVAILDSELDHTEKIASSES